MLQFLQCNSTHSRLDIVCSGLCAFELWTFVLEFYIKKQNCDLVFRLFTKTRHDFITYVYSVQQPSNEYVLENFVIRVGQFPNKDRPPPKLNSKKFGCPTDQLLRFTHSAEMSFLVWHLTRPNNHVCAVGIKMNANNLALTINDCVYFLFSSRIKAAHLETESKPLKECTICIQNNKHTKFIRLGRPSRYDGFVFLNKPDSMITKENNTVSTATSLGSFTATVLTNRELSKLCRLGVVE